MPARVITEPESYPVTVAEAKAHMNIASAFTADDTLIQGFIASAVEQAQNMTRRQMVEATWELVIDEFPSVTRANPYAHIELPNPPLLAVESVKYMDAEGVEQTLASGDYVVDTDGLVGRIYPVYGGSWPDTLDAPGAVAVRYSCGWEMDEAESPPAWTGPESIKTWIKVRVATMYEQREALVVGQAVADAPRSFVDGLLDPFVIPGI